jgi:hypothetical protein
VIAHARHQLTLALRVGLVDVGDVEDLLGRDQAEALQDLHLLGVADAERADRLAGLQRVVAALQHVDRRLQLLVVRRLLLEAVERGLHRLEIGEQELGVDRLDVADRVDVAVDVHDVRVLEAADHVEDRVDLADVGEELVAEPLALARAAHDARDVDDADHRGDDLLALDVLEDLLEVLVRHRDDADVRLDRAERVVLRCGADRRQRVEQRALADVRQTNDSDFESHGTPT